MATAALMTLMTAWLIVLPPGADAFSFGRHRAAGNGAAAAAPPPTPAKPAQVQAGQSQPGTNQDTEAGSMGSQDTPPAKNGFNPGAQTSDVAGPADDWTKSSFVQDSPLRSNPAKTDATNADLPNAAAAIPDNTKAASTNSDGTKKATINAPASSKPAGTSARPFYRKDFSGQFSYILPDGWRTFQIPYQVHDCLSLRENNKIVATISFADQLGKNDLTKLKDATVENDKQQVQKYEVLESKILTIPSGQCCAMIVGQGEIDEVAARQVQYIMELRKKHFLIATLTVAKPVGEKYDKLVQDVVASITTAPNPDKAIK